MAPRPACLPCDKTFASTSELNRHLATARAHQSVGQFPCLVPGCPGVYSRANERSRHMREKHSGPAQASTQTAAASATATATAAAAAAAAATAPAGPAASPGSSPSPSAVSQTDNDDNPVDEDTAMDDDEASSAGTESNDDHAQDDDDSSEEDDEDDSEDDISKDTEIAALKSELEEKNALIDMLEEMVAQMKRERVYGQSIQ